MTVLFSLLSHQCDLCPRFVLCGCTQVCEHNESYELRSMKLSHGRRNFSHLHLKSQLTWLQRTSRVFLTAHSQTKQSNTPPFHILLEMESHLRGAWQVQNLCGKMGRLNPPTVARIQHIISARNVHRLQYGDNWAPIFFFSIDKGKLINKTSVRKSFDYIVFIMLYVHLHLHTTF